MYKKKGTLWGGNNLRNVGRRKNSKIKNIILSYIKNNLKEYTIITIIFLIGLIFGIIFINNAGQTQIDEITSYINDFVNSLKNNIEIDKAGLLKDTLISNFVLALGLWFVGSTVIGIPIVYGIIAYRGFCLGYTISSSIATLGTGSGILFTITSLLLQNILFIPCILGLAVSGIKLYKSIVKDKRKETIKLEITRHTIFCMFILLVLELSAFLEVYGSTNLLQICAKYL